MKDFFKVFFALVILFPFYCAGTTDHHELRIQFQGTFSLYKHYPCLVFDKTIRKNNVIRFTIGGGPLATHSRSGDFDVPYNIPYKYNQHLISSSSNFSGAVFKISNLTKIYKHKKLYISGGFDLGAYLINDHYKVTIRNDSSQNVFYEKGNYFSKALSFGMLANMRYDITPRVFVNLVPQAMFYFDYWPTHPNPYDKRDPFFNWELEMGVGIGYLIVR